MSFKNLRNLGLIFLMVASVASAADTPPPPSDSGTVTLRQIEQLQQQKALAEAQTSLAKAQADARKAACDDGGCSPSVSAVPQRSARQMELQQVLSTVSIAGIYRKPTGVMSADLFVNTARVPVVEGSELPSGLRVTRITPSSVDVRTPSGQQVSLNFPGLAAVENPQQASNPIRPPMMH